MNIACANASCALRELTLHGKQVYLEGLQKLLRFHVDLDSGWTPETTDYDTLRDIVAKSDGVL
jgi:hypothetical protein